MKVGFMKAGFMKAGFMKAGGTLVESMPLDRKFVGSNPILAAVVGKRGLESQTKESARSADKRPSPGYCAAICFYYAALGHMFVLVGCGRGAGPYVSIGWLWAWRWAICLYWLAVGHMFLLCVCMCIC